MGTHILEPIPLLCSHKGEEGEASIAAGGATRGVSSKAAQLALLLGRCLAPHSGTYRGAGCTAFSVAWVWGVIAKMSSNSFG